jgi:hypothetical protein
MSLYNDLSPRDIVDFVFNVDMDYCYSWKNTMAFRENGDITGFRRDYLVFNGQEEKYKKIFDEFLEKFELPKVCIFQTLNSRGVYQNKLVLDVEKSQWKKIIEPKLKDFKKHEQALINAAQEVLLSQVTTQKFIKI